MNAAQQKNVTTWGIVILIVILVGLAATKRFKHQISTVLNPPAQTTPGGTTPGGTPPGGTPPGGTPPGGTPPGGTTPGGTTPGGTPPGGTTPPYVPPGPIAVQPSAAVPRETLDAVIQRIDAAPDSKYPFFRKAALKQTINTAKRIDLIATVNFDSGNSTLSAQGRSLIDQLLVPPRLPAEFSSSKEFQLLTVGYASPPGSPGTNLKLAEKRADSVKEYLETGKQLPMSRIHDISVGETQLLDSSESGKNQAVEIWLVEIAPENVNL